MRPSPTLPRPLSTCSATFSCAPPPQRASCRPRGTPRATCRPRGTPRATCPANRAVYRSFCRTTRRGTAGAGRRTKGDGGVRGAERQRRGRGAERRGTAGCGAPSGRGAGGGPNGSGGGSKECAGGRANGTELLGVGAGATDLGRLRVATDPDRLDVAELLDAVTRKLATVAGIANSPEGQLGERRRHTVDEDRPRIEAGDEERLLSRVVGPGVRAEAKVGRVRHRERLVG